MKANIFQRIAALGVRFTGAGGHGGGLGAWLMGLVSRGRYAERAGKTWKNSAVWACIRWGTKTFPEAPIWVTRDSADGKKEEVKRHALTVLLRRPNPFYSGVVLMAGTILSLIVDGNAYWLKVRSAAGKVVHLWYIPHTMIEPRWPEDGSVFISHYAYMVDGVEYPIPVQDVVHFRDGIDPENLRKGLSGLAAVLKEIVSDNEATVFTEAILSNMGIPGIVISPGEAEGEIDKTTGQKIKALINDRLTGEGRGGTVVLPRAIKIDVPGFSPEQLALDKIRQIPEARICAAIGIPAMVAGLSVGAEQRTYSNYKEAREAAYEEWVIPTQRVIAGDLDTQLLPDLGNPATEAVGFDLSGVRVLQEDRDALYRREAIAYNAGGSKRSEFRTAIGLKAGPDDEVYKTDLAPAAAPTDGKSGAEGKPAGEADAMKTLLAAREEFGRKARERRAAAEENL